LHIPWGVTMAPGSFLEDKDMNDGGNDNGGYGDKNFTGGDNKRGHHDQKDPVILVGNFGDGRINVFTQEGKFLGQLQSHKHPLEIEGLWHSRSLLPLLILIHADFISQLDRIVKPMEFLAI